MPTICLDSRYLTARPSGIGATVAALVEFLPELAPDWHFRLLRHAGGAQRLSTAANVTEVALRAPANGPAGMWLLPQLVDFSGVDLFHAPSNILPRGIPVPCVTTLHDLMWLTDPQLCNPRPWGVVERMFYRHGITRAVRQSNAIVTVSEATRAAIGAVFPEALAKTTTVLSGVPAGFSTAASGRLPDGLEGRDYILCIGQYAPYKNHEGAVRGFAAACADRPGMLLVMVQRQGPSNQALFKLAESLGIGDRVRFLPPVDQAHLVALYQQARGLLHPSWCEGFGLPLAEAMACGCPVITSDRAAMPEVTGGAALLVDPGDPAAIAAALTRLIDEPGLSAQLRLAGLARAAQLDRRESARAVLAVYRQALASAAIVRR